MALRCAGADLTRSASAPGATFTLAGWVLIAQSQGADTILVSVDNNTATGFLAVSTGGAGDTLRMSGYGGGGRTYVGVNTLGEGVWAYASIQRVDTPVQQATLKWRLEGETAMNDGGTMASDTFTPSNVRFGGGVVDVAGDIAAEDWRCWESALSDSELLAESRSPVPVRTTNLWGWWPMQRHAPDPRGYYDNVGARHLTDSGAAFWPTRPSYPRAALGGALLVPNASALAQTHFRWRNDDGGE